MIVGIVDYEAGNIRSVERALGFLGVSCVRSNRGEDLRTADKLIFPGVGEAFSAMEALTRCGLDSFLKDYAASGRDLLGICLGSQIILDSSEERNTACLGIIPGKALRFMPRPGLKIPHMGWNQVHVSGSHPLFKGIPEDSSFYFVHSYYPVPASDDLAVGTTEYGIPFASAFGRDNVYACQFHPEKSGPRGLQLLRNFLEM
ncbi:MAG: imidazole glycerol phosphate synthase subunit HisH [Spirochaetales bacterium]|nr:MAG: imidazole glycerol phosphate synthase subunit HisH [Spirochaetales bacterium]